MQNNKQATIGRFAPSPTGPLHFGSLVAAVASFLCARQNPNSKWLLRIEDVDTQREQEGATHSIIKTLEAYGFSWDDDIIYQSQRNHYYEAALDTIKQHIYACSCSRKELQTLSSENDSIYGYLYPGLCRTGIRNPLISNPSIRINTSIEKSIDHKFKEVCFQDECQADLFCQNIEREVGDFVLKRRDGLFAYQLAVIVDDYLQNVNHVVRGADLFDNTPRQIYLQNLLCYQTPRYLHFPVIISNSGKKLSKQNSAPEISIDNKQIMLKNLISALNLLGQDAPSAKEFSSISDIWSWGVEHWDSSKIPKTKKILYTP